MQNAGLSCAMVAWAWFGAAQCHAAAETGPRPNFLFILLDDQGWADSQSFGHPYMKTPNIDRLSREGSRFLQFYVNNPVCSPSRTAFMTGHYPARHGVHQHFATHPQNAARGMPNWLDPEVTTVCDALKQAGYATAHFGKWHLGGGEGAPDPGAYGIDDHRTVNSNGPGWDTLEKDRYFRAKSTGLFVDEAIRFIDAHKSGPFCVNLWTLVPHAHLDPTPEELAVYENLKVDPDAFPSWMRGYVRDAKDPTQQMKVFCAAMTGLDAAIGRLLDYLDAQGLARNTVVFFSSDNGPEDYHIGNAANAGMGFPGVHRARKRSLYEGGVRTPFVVRWPGRVEAGRVDETSVLTAVDFLPTVCKLAGVAVPDIRPDGEDVSDILFGKARARTKPIYWEWRGGVAGNPDYCPPRLAVRDGPWKLFCDYEGGDARLHDIPADPEERTNLASERPEVVARLTEKVRAWKETLPPGPVEIAPGKKSRPGARKPNILFCIADDASYPHMGAYGCTWVKTPGFDRVAREGILFTNAYTPNAKCAPSRACILTGRNSWQLKEACNHVPFFPPEFRVYTEALAAHGYFVGKTGKGWAPGVANDRDGKPRQLAGQPFDRATAQPPTKGISANDYAANFRDFLDANRQDRPWCFWYGGYEPHRGYEYGSGVAKGGKRPSDIDKVFDFWPDNEVVRNDVLDYAFEIEHFDRHLVKMLELLDQRGQLDDTLVVVTADNGMPFPRAKGQEYEFSNHLPLAVLWKGGIKNPGRVVDDYVSFIDFAPTFLEVAGLAWNASGMQPSPGRSLTDVFFSEKAGRVNPDRDHVLIGKERHDVGRPHDWGYPIRGIVKQGVLYLENFETSRWPAGNPETGYLNCDGSPTKTEVLKSRTVDSGKPYWQWSFGKRPREELYDVKADPACLANLAEKPDCAALKAALRRQLFDELRAQQDPRMFGQGHVFDDYIYAHEDVRGFYERYLRGERPKAGWVSPSDFD